MPPRKMKKGLKAYTTVYALLRKTFRDCRVTCPCCEKRMGMREFYFEHASEYHGIARATQCVFCFGGHSWPYRQKMILSNVDHVEECLKNFVNRYAVGDDLPSVVDDEMSEENRTVTTGVDGDGNEIRVGDENLNVNAGRNEFGVGDVNVNVTTVVEGDRNDEI